MAYLQNVYKNYSNFLNKKISTYNLKINVLHLIVRMMS